MTDSPQLEDSASVNERSLKRLVRALTFSQGRFSLNFVRCNYAELQAEMQQRLQVACAFEIHHLTLPKAAQTLFTAIKTTLRQEQPLALMVAGFESVTALDSLLIATNQVRDDFRKSFAFPLVLWIDDEVLRKLMRSAPDFSSWAGVPMQFAIDTASLLALLTRETDALFSVAMDVGAGRFPRSSALYPEIGSHSRGQLRLALKELHDRGQSPPPALKASLDFILGQAAYADEQMAESRRFYEQSLAFWQGTQEHETHLQETSHQETSHQETSPLETSHRIERSGCVLFYLGLWWRRWAVLHRAEQLSAWRKAHDYYQQCLQVLQAGDHPELAAGFINALGEVLLRLVKSDRVWADLESVAHTSVALHKRYADPLRLAYSYGLLAEVALSKAAWAEAADYAKQALDQNGQPPAPSLKVQPQYVDRRWMKQHYGSLYLLLWVQAQQHLDITYKEAIKRLERARAQCHHAYDPLLYIRILETLRSTHYRQQQYVKACETKREQRSIEQQYSLRAFIGAVRLRPERQVINPALIPIELPETTPETATSGDDRAEVLPPQPVAVAQEIIASGRYCDVERLLKRLAEPRYNLTIIHGQSGVGKSSLIGAGLVPALKQHPIGDRRVLPVVLRNYEKWHSALGQCLQEALNEQSIRETVPGLGDASELSDSQPLIDQLWVNADRHSLLTVLVFDQFEEFFFTYLNLHDRRPFLDVLHQCLNHLPFVKIVLSLRQDYLHYLLESSRLYADDITDNILSRDKRYPLGNFSIADTKTIIAQLTQRSEFHLEPALIDQLVIDLSAEQQEVRPIELQLVGAQLQESDITTLQAYQGLGLLPKEKLVERFLEQVIKDCGAENKQTATLVLYVLTDERGIRPLKAQSELIANLQVWDLAAHADQIALVLAIFVMSGLVLEMPDMPIKRYQLAHDYLATLVRQKLHQEVETYKSNRRVEKQNDMTRDRDRKQQKRLLVFAGFASVATVLALPALWFAGFAWDHMNDAAIAEIKANISLASGLARANDQLEALTQSINAGIKFNDQRQRPDAWLLPLATIEAPTVGKLLETVYSTQEQNRFVGHHLSVNSMSFTPQTRLFASASADRTIILWRENGTLLKRLEGHTSGVNSVSFSPDGQALASASDDRTMRLWDVNGRSLATLPGHTAPVTSVSFSPDGRMLASASDDRTVKLWDRRTHKLLNTLTAHTDRVKAVSFSPDGTLLATASWDGTARLWSRNGTLLRQFSSDLVQLCEANRTSLSEANKTSLSEANKTSLSEANRTSLSEANKTSLSEVSKTSLSLSAVLSQSNIQAETLCRENQVKLTSVSFSPDGKTIAVGGWDNRVKRWTVDGAPLQTLVGHTDKVTSVGFRPDGKVLLSASNDGTVKLWDLQTGSETSTLKIPGVSSARFLGGEAADATTVVTTGADQTVKLWQLNHTQPNTLVYETPVTSVSFSPDGQWLASASQSFGQDQKILLARTPDRTAQSLVETSINGEIKLWNLKNKAVKPLSLSGSFNRVTFSPSSRMLASAENSIAPNGQVHSQVKLWGLDGQLLNQQPINGEIADLSFSADGKTLAIAENIKPSNAPLPLPEPIQSGVLFWDLERHTVSKLIIQDSKINSLSLSNTGTIATASNDGTIRLWAKNGQALNPLKGHTDAVTSVSFSPDGTIASASADSTIRLWSGNGQPLRTLTGHNSPVSSVSFSGDGKLLVSGSEAGTIKVWNVADGLPLATLQPSDRRVNSVSFSPDRKLIASAGNDNQVQLWQFDLDPLLRLGCKWMKTYLGTVQAPANPTLCSKIDRTTGDR